MRPGFRFISWFLTIALVLGSAACSRQVPAVPLLTPPAVGVQISGNACPSIEVQAGMQVAWTNRGDVDRVVILERMNDQGVVEDVGGTDLLRPGDTFSTSLPEAGRYIYYCSQDRKAFGTIIVLPGSYPYP